MLSFERMTTKLTGLVKIQLTDPYYIRPPYNNLFLFNIFKNKAQEEDATGTQWQWHTRIKINGGEIATVSSNMQHLKNEIKQFEFFS